MLLRLLASLAVWAEARCGIQLCCGRKEEREGEMRRSWEAAWDLSVLSLGADASAGRGPGPHSANWTIGPLERTISARLFSPSRQSRS